jgi:hypothetical protein
MAAVKTLTAKPDAEVRVPQLTDYPAYVQARDRLHELGRELTTAEKLAQDERRLRRDRQKALDAMAQRVIEAPQAPGETARAALVEEVRADEAAWSRKTELEKEITVLRRAVELQEQKLRTIAGEVSGEICREVWGRYKDLAQKMAERTLQALHYSCQLQQMRDGLEQGGVISSLPFAGIGATLLGDPRQWEAGIHRLVKDLIDADILSGEEGYVRSLRALVV